MYMYMYMYRHVHTSNSGFKDIFFFDVCICLCMSGDMLDKLAASREKLKALAANGNDAGTLKK